MPTPQTKPTKRPMYYHMVILITIAAVAFALVAAAFYISQRDDLVNNSAAINANRATNAGNTNAAPVNVNVNDNANANPNATVITATSNWLTYANTKYGYSVKYPNDWADENTADANPAMFADPVAVAQTLETELLQGSKIEIVVDQNISASARDFAAGQDTESTILSEANMTVAGAAAVWRGANGPFGYYNVAYVKNASSIYRIIQYIPKAEDRGKYTAIYDQVLANFSFTH